MVKSAKFSLYWDAEATAQLEEILSFLAKKALLHQQSSRMQSLVV